MTTAVRRIEGIDGELLECPVWSVAEQALWLCDILGPALIRYDPATGAAKRWTLPSAIGSFALRAAGGLVVALRTGIHLFDPASERLELIAAADFDPATTRFNDGRCDRQGRFWVGSMFEPRTRPGGALYRLDADAKLHRVLDGVTIANGLAFPADGRTAYFADSPTRTVWRFDLDPTSGQLSNRREFRRYEEAIGRPDGGAADAEGCYWSAGIDSWQMLRFRPDGTLDRTVRVLVRWPTMPAFGGPDLKTVYVTSLREGRTAEQLKESPLAGSLFAFESDVAGLPEPAWAG